MIKDEIKKAVLKASGLEEVQLEIPELEEHGDYSSNVAMILAKKEKKNPKQVAGQIVEKLEKDKELGKIVSKIEVAGPGFINFWLTQEVIVSELERVVDEKEKNDSLDIGKGETVVVDYSAPNIAKKFSVGHLRSTIIGQALYNLYNFLGYKTIGDNHLGDWGTQFGTIIAQVVRKNLDVKNLSVDEIEKLYVEFNNEAKDDPELKRQGSLWFKKLEDGDSQARAIWQECVDISMKEFQRIWEMLDISIDYAYGESFYEDKMQAVIEEFRKKGVSKKSEGAEIVEFKDVAPGILLKSDGGTTYFTRDLATIRYRLDTWKPGLIIYEVGAEQTLHFRQVFAAAKLVGWVSGTDFMHVAHGLFLIDGKKMSTRKGTTVKLEEVLDGAIKKARELVEKSETGGDLESSEKDEIAKSVGIGAVKYFDLMHHPTSAINFSWDSIFNMQGNSGPYLQYTYARTQSVLKKAKSKKQKVRKDNEYKCNKEEQVLMRSFAHFSEVIIAAAKNYSPNLLCNYLYDLAQKFNNFYAKHRIISSDDGLQTAVDFRVALNVATGQVLKNGLGLLGIKTPERM